MANQVTQQIKLNSDGKATASLVLGIISFTPLIIIEILRRVAPIMELGPLINFVFFQLGPLIGIIGLILGVLSLKSTKRNFAITGIVLCLIGLLVPLYYFIFG